MLHLYTGCYITRNPNMKSKENVAWQKKNQSLWNIQYESDAYFKISLNIQKIDIIPKLIVSFMLFATIC